MSNSKKDKFYTIDVSTPRNGRVVVLGSYWICKDGNTANAVFFDRTAQCNQNKGVALRIMENVKEMTGWEVELINIPIAYRPNSAMWETVTK